MAGPVSLRLQITEITAQGFQGIALVVDLRLRAHAEAAKQRHRRTPALDRMLEQEAGDNRREKWLRVSPIGLTSYNV